MQITITKGASADSVTVERADGSRAGFGFPKKGPYHHDAYHFFVERELGMAAGFWGLVAGGMDGRKEGREGAVDRGGGRTDGDTERWGRSEREDCKGGCGVGAGWGAEHHVSCVGCWNRRARC